MSVNYSSKPIPTEMSIGDISSLTQLQATGCTAGNYELYSAVERSIKCAIGSEGSNVGPLGKSLVLAEAVSKPPISCMIDIATGSDCNTEISPDRRRAAYRAFTDVTGFQPANLGNLFAQVTNEQRNVLNMTAFYIFFPMFILILIGVWLMAGFDWIAWPVALFISVLAFILLYGFSMLYRMQVYNNLVSQDQIWKADAQAVQNNLANSVAYWPQGLFAVACAVTATGGTGWTCNEPGNPQSDILPVRGTCTNGACAQKGPSKQTTVEQTTEQVKSIRKRRATRRQRINP